ncbi:sugar fermentation stimulation protein [Thermaerobacter marianensis DSM 12885]|uniref:Sugar fermentation stimulation protein homolog n=1 Tax=Thermaerobacter marianensis (strain ATCC 700841 / DSM 12885 / JCM 10246 / 7p75a) TaxID=644966 RepID=E6SLV4_THEM7|nr:DNA/RNA nuclease SfsA [Thermaerobacter marianensis]ADU51403.1 sugar fermentation stimulation protein [Thermaerobacter marianensis DSM 12885]
MTVGVPHPERGPKPASPAGTAPAGPVPLAGAPSPKAPPGRVPVAVAWPRPLVPVIVVRRLNRFAVEVLRGKGGAGTGGPAGGGRPASEEPLRLHLPNSGRMEELLAPGTPGLAWLRPDGASRRTAGELLLVAYAGRWVSVDARMPNRLFAAALGARALPPFAAYRRWQPEAAWGAGRLDFRLDDADPPAPPCLVETKSCNLVEDGTALFPDAPTARGSRHLDELAAAARQGWRAAVVWFVQRDDARRLAPHRRADPAFADALQRARAAGVEAYAYRCCVTPDAIEVLDAIPVVAGRDS